MADEEVPWTVDMEVNLLYAMRRHKPVGVNRHFQMICIHNKLTSSLPKKITAKQIWSKLSSMYDLQALNESEIVPFPNTEMEFLLPETDFNDPKKKNFPRVMKENTTSTEDAKESSKDSKSKVSAIEKVSERLADANKDDDSPKREQRKRTRQAAQSPATTENITPTSKRARRT